MNPGIQIASSRHPNRLFNVVDGGGDGEKPLEFGK
jgi:hypothetical protein